MAFLRRIKQSHIKALSNQFQRSYFQIHSPCRVSHTYSTTKYSVFNYPSSPIQRCQFEFLNNVRFLAAPVQATQKREEKDTGPRLNEQITAHFVRLVTEEGHFVVPKQEALKRARDLELDLVEVQRNAQPPVCKLMDYNREKYQQELKEKDRAKSKSEGTLRKGACKEIRFSGNITQKDLQIKVDTVKRLMERGYRVKCQAKGKKNKETDEGEDSATLLSRILALIEDISVVESDTRVEDKDQAHIIVRHIKYGLTKKGLVKKGSRDNKSVTSSTQEEESDNDEDVENEKSGWKFDDANDDFDKIFELKESPDVTMNLSNEKTPFASESSSSSSGVSSHYASAFPRLDSASRTATSSSVVGTENRYMKDPRSSAHHRSPMDASCYGEGNKARLGPQFSGSGSRPRLNMNSSPTRRETEDGKIESSTFQNMKTPEQAPFNIASSPPPSSGMFRQVDNAPGKQSSPAETNRYKQRNASDPARNRSPLGHMGHANAKVGKEQAANKDGQGSWGMFSCDGSNMINNRKHEGQAKLQK